MLCLIKKKENEDLIKNYEKYGFKQEFPKRYFTQKLDKNSTLVKLLKGRR